MSSWLMLMRHGKSSWADPGQADFDRPLKGRGRRATQVVAAQLMKAERTPQRVASSPAVRARETAELLAAELGAPPPELFPELYHAEPEVWREFLSRQATGRSLLVVGHNPGLEELALEIAGAPVRVPTAAVLFFQSRVGATSWDAEKLRLVDAWRPREV